MKATSFYALSLIFGLFIPNLAKALTCNSDCRAYASERYVCGYSVTWKSQKPKMCDWVNPVKKAQCETIKELDCAKNKVGDWLQDAFNEDPRFMTSRDKSFKSIVNDTSIFQMDFTLNPANQKT